MIRRSELPTDKSDAVPAYQVFFGRLMAANYRMADPVQKVWLTRYAIYWRKPEPNDTGEKFQDGDTVFYKTESEAYLRVLEQLDWWHRSVRSMIEKMYLEAKEDA